jgi:hypothetical protein
MDEAVSDSTQAHRPADIPVSSSIVLPPGSLGEELRRALAAVDRVHSDGALPRIVVAPEPSLADESSYEWAEDVNIVLGIAMRPDARHPALNLLHEIGHFLDHQAIGDIGSFASPVDARLAAWRSAVKKSDAVRQLRVIAQRASRVRIKEHVEYLLRIEELWARSYAQFITITSHDVGLLDDLRQDQPEPGRLTMIPVQWHNDDFLPISESILELFQTLGWIT